MDFVVGQIVISKSGRDKGLAFVIKSIEGEYVYLVDGKLRKLDKPKKKKQKHVQPTKTVSLIFQDSLVNDANIRNEIEKAQSV